MAKQTIPNHFKIFLAVLFVVGAAFLDHSSIGWVVERPVVEWVAQKTGRSLPQVTAVVLPLNEGVLAPQDVALTLRACSSFHPQKIMVAEPMGDFTNGPFSLIREGMETGSVAGVPFCYDLSPQEPLPAWKKPHPRLLALDDFLLKREEMERGAIRPELDLFFRDQTVVIGGPTVAARAECVQSEQEQQIVHPLHPLFYGMLLMVLIFGSLLTVSLWSLDFALVVVFFILCYGAGTFFLFRGYGILLPLFLPMAFLLIVCLKKLIPSCATRKEE